MSSVGQVGSESLVAHGPVLETTLRMLAGDLRAGADLAALLRGLGRALDQVPSLRGVSIEASSESPGFETDRLSIPLVGSAGMLGMMKLAGSGGGVFQPGRLKLAAALAELVAVVVDQALSARNRAGSTELVSVALDELPVGVLCFDGGGSLVFANTAAQQMVAGRLPPNWESVWTTLAPPVRRVPGSAFVLREGSRLIHANARRLSDSSPGAVVLTDLGARIHAFSDALAGDVYRGIVEHRPVVLGVLAGPAGSPAAFEVAERARELLPQAARTGPIDGEALGILLLGATSGACWRLLRDIASRSADDVPLSAGVAALRSSGDTPGAFVARAVSEIKPIRTIAKAELLVCDQSFAVGETLALILRHDYSVTCVAERRRCLGLLQEQPYDGLVLELPSPDDAEASAFVERALEIQPGARPFFVTSLPRPWPLREWGLPEGTVFRKPFAVQEVRAAVRAAFSGQEPKR